MVTFQNLNQNSCQDFEIIVGLDFEIIVGVAFWWSWSNFDAGNPLFIQPTTPRQHPSLQMKILFLTGFSTQSAFFCISIFFCLQKGEQDDFL